MDIEGYIKKIVNDGRIEDMEELSDMLEDTMEIIKKYDEKCYEEYELKLYKLAYGNNLNRQMAEKIVRNMQPYGMKWSIEETSNIQRDRGINDIPEPAFFTVMNSAYNDYNNLFGEDVENYVKFTLDFIDDEDAKEGKVFLYFTTIPR